MRRALVATVVLLLAVLAGAVSYRLSADALALLVGVILGVLISAPVTLILVWSLRREVRCVDRRMPAVAPAPPAVVVVQPPVQNLQRIEREAPWPSPQQSVQVPVNPREQRTWSYRVVGEIPEEDRVRRPVYVD